MLPTTPFRNRLKTNHVPSTEETIAIRKLIEVVEPQIVSLDAEIEAMKQRRAVYASFVEDHRALISPIRYMPPDILCNIFSYCVLYATPERVMRASEAPLLLAQICHHWRDLVINTPTLWSTIFVKIPEPPQAHSYAHISYDLVDAPERDEIDVEVEGASEALSALLVDEWRQKMESLVGATTTWLSRAEGCPLTIFFRDHYPIYGSILDEALIQESVNLLLSFICARSSQWAQLDLRVAESSSSEESILSLSPSQTPHLRSIHVEWTPPHGGPLTLPLSNYSTSSEGSSSGRSSRSSSSAGRNNYDAWKTLALPNFPLNIFKATGLQRLSLESFRGDFQDIPVAWSNLTELSCTRPPERRHKGPAAPPISGTAGISPSVALAILQQCPNLVRCELHLLELSRGSRSDALSTRHVHLPYLQHFVVLEDKQCPSPTFFNSLTDLPLLTSMSWGILTSWVSLYPPTGGLPPPPPPHLSIYPLLSILGHQIQCLEFGSMPASITHIVDCLKLAVGVTELMINMSNLTPPTQPLPSVQGPTLEEDTAEWGLPRPFYRDEVLASLTPSDSEVSAETPICPNLSILKITLTDLLDITTKALKKLVTLRTGNLSPGQEATQTVPLTEVTVRFMGLGGYHDDSGRVPPPIFPKRWEEGQLNSDFSRHIIKVEWPRATAGDVDEMNSTDHYIESARKMPFEKYWDSDSKRHERSRQHSGVATI
ncbi:hypothetical protein BKA70DRAFT_1560189 [Coprinopsis sp. MPI-PUGE-AT-0042]|nr:hypothetical protein BKA70DRAFT_1560189 [Coprinopsis sp. MPI-PUGE-AT-0042]